MFETRERHGIWYIYCPQTGLWSGAQMGESIARGAASMLNRYHATILGRSRRTP